MVRPFFFPFIFAFLSDPKTYASLRSPTRPFLVAERSRASCSGRGIGTSLLWCWLRLRHHGRHCRRLPLRQDPALLNDAVHTQRSISEHGLAHLLLVQKEHLIGIRELVP